MDIVITNTKRKTPPRILLYGDGGTGKSNLAAAFPHPLFINVEDGLDEIDTQALPIPKTFDDVMSQLVWIYENGSDFRTIISDSLDHLEIIINKDVCEKNDVSSISEISFGGGYTQAFDRFQQFLTGMSAIRIKNNSTVVFICHGHVRTFNNVSGADYDRFELKLREKTGQLFFEFCTLVGFLHLNISVKKEKAGFKEKTKAIGGNLRVLSCQPSAGFQSKNRYGITTDISLPSPQEGYNNLIKAITGETK